MESQNHADEASNETKQDETVQRKRAMSHKDYLDTLQRPSATEVRRISDIQVQLEQEVDAKYHSSAETKAAETIQKAYRGHRERRQLDGLSLDPSSRWKDAIKEWRYRVATASYAAARISDGGHLSPSETAKENWFRATTIAEHAGSGENSACAPAEISSSTEDSIIQKSSMLMDLRYFLEMVDLKHRYGANLQIYHLEWQRSGTKENFFYWLDKGSGRQLSLPYCDRAQLDRERIRYLTKEERKDYLVVVDNDGKLRWEKNGELISTSADHFKDSMHGIVPKEENDATAFTDDATKQKLSQERKFTRQMAAALRLATEKVTGDNASDEEEAHDDTYDSSTCSSPTLQCPPQDEILAHQTVTKDKTPRKRFHVSPATILNHLLRASVKPGTWIYVCDTVGRLYVGIKNSGSFQHASFLSGARISSAGSIGIENGQLTFLSPLSGHYRPTTKSFRLFIDNLKRQEVDLSKLRVSHAYQILLGMEYYGKTKAGLKKVSHKGNGTKETQKAKSQSESDEVADELSISPATEVVEKHWKQHHHRRGLAKLMDDLNIRRKSQEQMKGPV
ncbi:IQ domain-containing protein IQM1 [Acrodontium crateriforme]|uniref:IQ domain-containing protein IQM1 n=1 Tax=Acrodontium crateriforme TaxID=150365 RepID=A0AAQ3M8H5_9PEZI|nr:IQ domain-containing protein IQM1 [Acrodontium crateriforme]